MVGERGSAELYVDWRARESGPGREPLDHQRDFGQFRQKGASAQAMHTLPHAEQYAGNIRVRDTTHVIRHTSVRVHASHRTTSPNTPDRDDRSTNESTFVGTGITILEPVAPCPPPSMIMMYTADTRTQTHLRSKIIDIQELGSS